jgi:hypothetical protein
MILNEITKKNFFAEVTQRPWQCHALRIVLLKKSFLQISALDAKEYLGKVSAILLVSCGRYRSEWANELKRINITSAKAEVKIQNVLFRSLNIHENEEKFKKQYNSVFLFFYITDNKFIYFYTNHNFLNLSSTKFFWIFIKLQLPYFTHHNQEPKVYYNINIIQVILIFIFRYWINQL